MVGVPSDDFCAQAPGTSECEREYAWEQLGRHWPVLDKAKVNGPEQIDLYSFIKFNPNSGIGLEIQWNYEKCVRSATEQSSEQ